MKKRSEEFVVVSAHLCIHL